MSFLQNLLCRMDDQICDMLRLFKTSIDIAFNRENCYYKMFLFRLYLLMLKNIDLSSSLPLPCANDEPLQVLDGLGDDRLLADVGLVGQLQESELSAVDL